MWRKMEDTPVHIPMICRSAYILSRTKTDAIPFCLNSGTHNSFRPSSSNMNFFVVVFVLVAGSSSYALSASDFVAEEDHSISSIVDGERLLRATDDTDREDDEERRVVDLVDPVRKKLYALNEWAGTKLHKLNIKVGDWYNRISLNIVLRWSRNFLDQAETAKDLMKKGASFDDFFKEGITPAAYFKAKDFGRSFVHIKDTPANRREVPGLSSCFEYRKFYDERMASLTKLQKLRNRIQTQLQTILNFFKSTKDVKLD
ncbi:hypothetical protein PsorP6_014598 [Peronosclerospora sorghi]|uniref:Uncharacterized protein n=1 Tax=Peronosclerospora sorghi TaxID=230839 RepID=A0ACC0VS69_9STRA|nr:hypothetical protein PsorP6_014598 [Peronosclerospora sorghi]